MAQHRCHRDQEQRAKRRRDDHGPDQDGDAPRQQAAQGDQRPKCDEEQEDRIWAPLSLEGLETFFPGDPFTLAEANRALDVLRALAPDGFHAARDHHAVLEGAGLVQEPHGVVVKGVGHDEGEVPLAPRQFAGGGGEGHEKRRALESPQELFGGFFRKEQLDLAHASCSPFPSPEGSRLPQWCRGDWGSAYSPPRGGICAFFRACSMLH
ncbi:hypothetical protein D3C86_1049020 [compost metagenome]